MPCPELPIAQRSWPSKQRFGADEAKKPLRFEAASAARQHPLKEQQQYIYADAVCYGSKWLGVCDGVSGVQKMGIAPDVLPRELLMQCQKIMESCARDEHGAWVLSMLKEAFAGTSALGATTVLLACIEERHQLSLVTLGDCALLQLRPSNGDELRRSFRSQRVMMGEKTPAQVLRLPHQITGEQKELVEDCRLDMVNIKHGDLIVLGSDGLFDNLSDEAITDIVQRFCCQPDNESGHLVNTKQSRLIQQLPVLYKTPPLPSAAQLQQAAISLVDAAIRNVVLVPDSAAAPPLVARGNPDDTTVIVAVVIEEGKTMESDSEVELHDLYPEAEAMLSKAGCSDQGVCNAGFWPWPICCYSSAIDRDDNEDSELSSDHVDDDSRKVNWSWR